MLFRSWPAALVVLVDIAMLVWFRGQWVITLRRFGGFSRRRVFKHTCGSEEEAVRLEARIVSLLAESARMPPKDALRAIARDDAG